MKEKPYYKGEVTGQPAMGTAQAIQEIARRFSRLQGVQRLGLDEWELRLLLKVYRPVRGLVRWVRKVKCNCH